MEAYRRQNWRKRLDRQVVRSIVYGLWNEPRQMKTWRGFWNWLWNVYTYWLILYFTLVSFSRSCDVDTQIEVEFCSFPSFFCVFQNLLKPNLCNNLFVLRIRPKRPLVIYSWLKSTAQISIWDFDLRFSWFSSRTLLSCSCISNSGQIPTNCFFIINHNVDGLAQSK